MGPIATGAAQIMRAEVEPGAASSSSARVVVKSRPFQLEEQQLGLDRRCMLLNPLEQGAACRLRRVGREEQ